MTRAEYARAQNEARRGVAALSLKAQLAVKLAYRRATADVAKTLLDAHSRGLSLTTVTAQSQLLIELQASYTKLSGDISSIIDDATMKAAVITSTADQEYLNSAISGIGASQFNADVVRAIYTKVNTDAVRITAQRIHADGYNLSTRVWNLKNGYEATVKELILAGIAQGRDPVKIVRDLQLYVAGGKPVLAQRWGKLERGAVDWKKRIKGDVDYRAQRLVRSEIHATVQATAIQSGLANPGATGEFQWVLGPGLAHCEECADNASRTYTQETIPDYPHPNCGCQVRPVLRSREEFVESLKRWKDGIVDDGNRYIDDWAQRYANVA